MTKSPKLVSVVGGGKIKKEFDIGELAKDLDAHEVQYSESHPAINIKYEDRGPMVLLYRTGSYNIRGAKSVEEAYRNRDRLYDSLYELDIDINDKENDEFKILNLVYTSDVGESLNLNRLAVHFGLEHIEYEPEQFPGLIYRSTDPRCVVLFFSSGKVVITGLSDPEVIQAVYERILEEL